MGHNATDLTDLLAFDPTPTTATLPAVATEAELAFLLGVSSARVRALAREGVAVKVARGRFDTAASVTRYCERLRASASRAGRPATDETKLEKLRLTKAQADAQELKNQALRGDLVPVTEVRREWTAVATDLRASLLSIPARVAARAGLSREAAMHLEDEVRAALEDLTDER